MKYLKNFPLFENKIDSLSDEELEQQLDQYRKEYQNIQKKILSLSKEKENRKDSEDSEIIKKLPNNIFEYSIEQTDWLFSNANRASSFKYSFLQKVCSQLTGVYQIGLNPNSDQQRFSITFYDISSSKRRDQIRSLEFLGSRLKPVDLNPTYPPELKKYIGNQKVVEFEVMMSGSDRYEDKIFFIPEDFRIIYYKDRYDIFEYHRWEETLVKLYREYEISKESEED